MSSVKNIVVWAVLVFFCADILALTGKTSTVEGWSALWKPVVMTREKPPSLSPSALTQLPSTMQELKNALKTLSSSLLLLKETDAEMQKTVDVTQRLNNLLSDEEKLLGQAVVVLRPLAYGSRKTNMLTLYSTKQTRSMENVLRTSLSASQDILKEIQQVYAQAKFMRDSMAKTLVSMQKLKDKLPKNLPK